MWPALTFLEEFMIFIPTESDLWACKLTHVCSPISVCCMCSSPLRKRQKTMARLIGCIPTVAEFRGSELVMGVEVGDWAEQFFYCLSAKWRLENDWEACVGRVQRLAALSGRRWAGKQVAFNFGDFFLGGWFNPEREKNEQRERLNNVIWVHFAFEFVYISRRMSHCALFRWKYYFIRVCMWVQQMTLLYFLPLWVNHFQFMSVTEYFLLGWNLACEDRQRTFLPLRDLISLL